MINKTLNRSLHYNTGLLGGKSEPSEGHP